MKTLIDHTNRQSSRFHKGVSSQIFADDVPVDVPERRKGRGATFSPAGRFENEERITVDDGWESLQHLPALKTDVTIENPKSIITKNQSPDLSFDRSINPYRGCEHGCTYCFARPSHAYLGLSPGVDFESKLFAKPNAAELLEKELANPHYQPRTIAIGTNTDPYQPIERTHRIMREVLEVLERASHPVGIVTKSALVTRDTDILSRMAERNLVKVALSITTLDGTLARSMEPRAATPQRRLDALKLLSAAGIPAAVLVAPVIPGLTDHEMETILARAKAAGAQEAGYVLLRLPLEVRDIFTEWLKDKHPNHASRVLSLMKTMRQGMDYDATWGRRMTGTGPHAWTIGRRFEMAAKRHHLNTQRRKLRTDLFQRPLREGSQMALF